MQKKKSGVKNVWKFVPLRGGGIGPLMANAISNFHFDYLTTSLVGRLKKFKVTPSAAGYDTRSKDYRSKEVIVFSKVLS